MLGDNGRTTLTRRTGLRRLFAAMSLAAASLAFAACQPTGERADVVDGEQLQAAVDHLLTESEKAWNGGDLAGFMEWYKRGEETTFLGSSGLTHGWDTIRQRYEGRFEPGASRDSLRFEELVTRPLTPWLGLATARYVLFQGDSVTSTGVFTLVVERTPEGWRIIHDQSAETGP
jgi:beta-aspartyl-peptidase (threonine type)